MPEQGIDGGRRQAQTVYHARHFMRTVSDRKQELPQGSIEGGLGIHTQDGSIGLAAPAAINKQARHVGREFRGPTPQPTALSFAEGAQSMLRQPGAQRSSEYLAQRVRKKNGPMGRGQMHGPVHLAHVLGPKYMAHGPVPIMRKSMATCT